MVEELEHRAVAFDIMQAAGVGEVERVAGMGLALALLLPSVVGGLVVSLAGDRATWNPLNVARSLRRFRRSAIVQRSFLRDLLSYERPGFHPDERSIDDLLATWNEELFSPEGLLGKRAPQRAS